MSKQLNYAKRVHSKLTGDKTLAQVLQELKYITPEQLQDTLSASKVGGLLVELGLITNHDLETAINCRKNLLQRRQSVRCWSKAG